MSGQNNRPEPFFTLKTAQNSLFKKIEHVPFSLFFVGGVNSHLGVSDSLQLASERVCNFLKLIQRENKLDLTLSLNVKIM